MELLIFTLLHSPSLVTEHILKRTPGAPRVGLGALETTAASIYPLPKFEGGPAQSLYQLRSSSALY
jgi:hypothetical protein